MQLMAPEKMRRDQIWFCEKKGASSLYSLDDFDKKKIKTTTPYAAWYDEVGLVGFRRKLKGSLIYMVIYPW
jgi:hypothetical protein